MSESNHPSSSDKTFPESKLVGYCRAFRQEEKELTPGGLFRFYRTGFFVIGFYTSLPHLADPEQRMIQLPPALSETISRLWLLGDSDWDVIFLDFDNEKDFRLSYQESTIMKGIEHAIMDVVKKLKNS